MYLISPALIVFSASLAAGINGYKSAMSFVNATRTTNAKSTFFNRAFL